MRNLGRSANSLPNPVIAMAKGISHAAQRRQKILLLHKRYKRVDTDGKCVYCGDLAESDDHVPSLLDAYAYGADALIESGRDLKIYPACIDCNSRLQKDAGLDPISRQEVILNRLRRLLSRFQSDWDEDELDELGPSLRSTIEKHFILKKALTRRVEYASDLSNILKHL